MTSSKYKITYVYPDFENLGVEYLMSLCLKAGYEVKLIRYQAENSYIGFKPKKIAYNEIAHRIIATNPDIVAFSCVTDNYQYQLQCARSVKKLNPNIKTIFGGIHPTAVPETVLRKASVDAVAIGEADISFINFLNFCRKEGKLILPKKEIEGIVFKKGKRKIGKFIEGPLVNLDSLPFPNKELFFSSVKDFANEYSTITSRGCPYCCTYCFNSFMRIMRKGKNSIRQRSVDNVINELLLVKKKYKVKRIIFYDDSFTTNRKWVEEFSRKYKRSVGIAFACIANPDYIDKKVARLLKKAGCVFIQIGIQSINKDICRNVIHRAVTKEKIIKTIKALKEVGIMIQVDHMLGIPGDTIKNQEEAILFYNKYRPDFISLFWLIYYPNTPIIQTALDNGLLRKKDINKINQGERLTKGSIHDGGNMKNPEFFYGLQLLFNYLPFLPKWLVKILINRRLYKLFTLHNYYLSTALPRAILCLVDKRYFIGRTHFIYFMKTLLRRFSNKNFIQQAY